MKERFKQEYKRIQAPEQLKEQTKRLMREQMLSEEMSASGDPVGDGSAGDTGKPDIGKASVGMSVVKRSYTRRRRAGMFGMAVLFAAAVCIAIYAFFGRDSFYVTPVSEDGYYAEVEVKDGMICFAGRGEELELTPNASRHEGDEEKPDGQDEAGENSSIRVKEGTGSLPAAREEEYSYVAGEQFLVTVTTGGETIYTAYFARDGILYTITGEHVSQKQFLDYLRKNFLEK